MLELWIRGRRFAAIVVKPNSEFHFHKMVKGKEEKFEKKLLKVCTQKPMRVECAGKSYILVDPHWPSAWSVKHPK